MMKKKTAKSYTILQEKIFLNNFFDGIQDLCPWYVFKKFEHHCLTFKVTVAQDLPILNFSVCPIFTNFPNFQRPKVKAKGQRTKQWLNIWASSLLAPPDCFWCSWGPPDGLGGPINIFCISLIKCSIVSSEATRRPSVATRRLLTHKNLLKLLGSLLMASWQPQRIHCSTWYKRDTKHLLMVLPGQHEATKEAVR